MIRKLIPFLFLFPGALWATVTNQTMTVSFTCTGTVGPFPFTFPINDATALTVTQNGVLLNPGVYTLTPVNKNFTYGGSVSLKKACPAGQPLVLTRITPLTQTTVLADNTPKPMPSIMYALDKLTEINQEQNVELDSVSQLQCPVGQVLQSIPGPICVQNGGPNSGLPLSGGTMTGPLIVPVINNVCNAYGQNSSSLSAGVTACLTALPGTGGIIDATGYQGLQTVAGLNIYKSVELRLGAVTLDLTGSINATDLPNGVTIRGVGSSSSSSGSLTSIIGDTGTGKPVIDFTGTSGAKLYDLAIFAGSSTPSTIGVLEARTATNPNTWRTHFKDVVIQMTSNHGVNRVFSVSMTLTSGSSTAAVAWFKGLLPGEWLSGTGIPTGTFITSVGDAGITLSNAATQSGVQTISGYGGSVAIYNYGAENTHYENVTLVGDVPLVLSAENIFNVTAPNVAFYTGYTTMQSVVMDGKSDVYSSAESFLLDAAGNILLDPAEADGAALPGHYGVVIHGNNTNLHIYGEFENFTRAIYLDGFASDSNFWFVCATCHTDAYTGNLTTTNLSTTATPASMTGIVLGQAITNVNVPRGAYVSAINASTITMSEAATAGATTTAVMTEPYIILDGSFAGSGTPVTVSNTNFHVGGTASILNETYYILNVGANIASSTGWKAYLPTGTNIAWAGAQIAGDVYEPYQTGFSDPLISATINATVHSSLGVTPANSPSAKAYTTGAGTPGTYYPTFVSSSANGNQQILTSSGLTLDLATGTIGTGSNTVPVVATPTAGQAACIKSAGPPVIIGYCSTAVDGSGACTCN